MPGDCKGPEILNCICCQTKHVGAWDPLLPGYRSLESLHVGFISIEGFEIPLSVCSDCLPQWRANMERFL